MGTPSADGTTQLLRPIRHQSDGAHTVLYHAFQLVQRQEEVDLQMLNGDTEIISLAQLAEDPYATWIGRFNSFVYQVKADNEDGTYSYITYSLMRLCWSCKAEAIPCHLNTL